MAVVNFQKKEINVKIVYAGPVGSGKTTNLAMIFKRLKPEFRGQSRIIPLGANKLHLCEFQPPLNAAIPGFSLRFHLYTLTGEESGEAEWRMVIKGADGIVFVADANPALSENTQIAFTSLLNQLNGLGIDLSQVPIVVQANHQDFAEAMQESELQKLFSSPGITIVPACAVRGEGVLETLASVVRKVTTGLQKMDFTVADAADEESSPDELHESFQDSEYSDNGEIFNVHAETTTHPVDACPPDITIDEQSLSLETGTVEIPLRLHIAGVEKLYLLSIGIREASREKIEPLRGAAYVR